jgi:hypothetical protein
VSPHHLPLSTTFYHFLPLPASAPTNSSFTPGACTKVDNPTLYYVGDHGKVKGADKYKAEIFARGPIGAGIDATAGLEAYTGGTIIIIQ